MIGACGPYGLARPIADPPLSQRGNRNDPLLPVEYILICINEFKVALLHIKDCDIRDGPDAEMPKVLTQSEEFGRPCSGPQENVLQRHAEVEEFGHRRHQIENRSLRGAPDGEIGRNDIGHESKFESFSDDGEVEMPHPAVCRIEQDSTLLRLPDGFKDSRTLSVHDAVGKRVEWMRQDITASELLDHLRQGQRAIRDMHHEGNTNRICSLACETQGFERIPRKTWTQAEFYPDEQITVRCNRSDACLWIRVATISKFTGCLDSRDSNKREIEEGAKAGANRARQQFPETRKVQRACTTCVACRSNPAGCAIPVGMRPHVTGVRKGMEVSVDEAGRDDPPLHIENFNGISVQAILDCRDATSVHGDIHDAVTVVLRVNNQTLLQEEIISHLMFTFG
ncbi:hypothetical protein FACS1894158_05410 [Betaproteobacteria bacterium]|nr:hypothetical protein FACS1894158_05410 [Betaproteobacteria bacterium]